MEGFNNKREFKTILIEGNISSGKTTFLNYLKRYDDMAFIIPEPIDKWCDFNGCNLLNEMYNDVQTWGPSFQSYVLLTMISSHIIETEKPYKIMERSCHSAMNCFAKNMMVQQLMDPGMYNVLKEWYDFINWNMDLSFDKIVYIRTSPTVIYNRMIRRGRKEEENVTLEYLTQIHEMYEDWLFGINAIYKDKILVLNGDLDESEIGPEYLRIEDAIFQQ
ncbi:putative deoxynucleoside kinase protein [Drosophila innubila nudivirus]|uniref:Putative deoxynucleoside kinase protein n=1 Tax=Drosophila innubila nudivirus TaxID=2057187 RepID=A0A2H4UXD2_9VIRU|nr:putative deoxynucleoside kinase protein [Drosophila innubila nudivirus]ATZ81569.1 putative deoxynucleoside kinase protein [Drosophila innubila nudivirus]